MKTHCRRHDGYVSFGMIAVGLIILAFGALLLVNNLGLTDVRHLWRQFWPIAFVIAGAAILLQPGQRHGRWWGIVWIVAGVWIYADMRGWINVNFWAVFGPAILLLMGGALVWRAVSASPTEVAGNENAVIRSFTMMSGAQLRPVSPEFQGGELAAVMGGIKLDLSDVRPETEVVTVNVFAMMGGVEILVPNDWEVTSKITTLLGGFADQRRPSPTAAATTPVRKLVLTGMAVMGGVEVKSAG